MRAHDPSSVPPPVGRYVHAAELAGPATLLFVSGQIPEALDGSVPEGFESQCRLAWAHVFAALASAGLARTDLLKVTTYLADVEDAGVNSRVRQELLGDHRPALTVVGAALLDPRWRLEIEAVAGSGREEKR